jgi:hypothetical protein
MQFLKDLLRNLVLLFVIGLVLLAISPNIMTQTYQALGGLFGPGLILIVIAGALPRRRRS